MSFLLRGVMVEVLGLFGFASSVFGRFCSLSQWGFGALACWLRSFLCLWSFILFLSFLAIGFQELYTKLFWLSIYAFP
jgi:hypothetical protein